MNERTIELFDFVVGCIYPATFQEVRQVGGGIAAYGVATYDHPEWGPTVVSVCVVADGTVYTTTDWQAPVNFASEQETQEAVWIDPRDLRRLSWSTGFTGKL